MMTNGFDHCTVPYANALFRWSSTSLKETLGDGQSEVWKRIKGLTVSAKVVVAVIMVSTINQR